MGIILGKSMPRLGVDFKSEISAAKQMRLPWWGVLSWTACCFPVIALLDHFGEINLALPILNSVGMFGFLIALKWKLRKFAWFWAIVLIMAGLHVPLILLIPWTVKWVPAVAIASIDTADLIMLLWLVSLVGNFMGTRKTLRQ